MKFSRWLDLNSSSALVGAVVALAACTSGTAAPPAADGPGAAGAGASPSTNTAGTGVGPSAGAGPTGSGGSSAVSPPPPFAPAPGMLRRLTRAQFSNAMQDLLAVDVDETQLDPDSWDGNFAVIGASTVVTSPNGVEQYQSVIENALATVFTDSTKRSKLLGCTPGATPSTDTCVRGFLSSFGRRAWRRPLESAELDRLISVAQAASTALSSAVEGAHWATVALLSSPNFLYRPELGVSGADGTMRFTGFEMASRLSFLLWNSVPDAALLDSAEKGELSTPAGVRTAVERMLDAPAGRHSVGDFAEEFMRLDRVTTQAKDPGLFPEYNATLQAAMVKDMRGVWEAIAFDDNASALSLFSTKKVIVNASLAKLYGVETAGLTETVFKTLTLPDNSPRIGILGKAGFLSQFANQKEGSPTLRGKFIRDSLMCLSIPPPPGDVTAMLVEPPADQPMTKRQRLELHRTEARCAGCHGKMDPLGLPLETFDAIGRYRTLDHGLPIDPSGDIDGVAVADAQGLEVALSASAAVAQCLVRRYYTYASGHAERAVDQTVEDALSASFQASGYKLRDLIVDTVTHEAFSTVAPQE